MRAPAFLAASPWRATLAAAILVLPWLPLPDGGPVSAARVQAPSAAVLTVPVPAVDPADRPAVIAAYRAYYLPDEGVPASWTGSLDGGDPGTVSPGFLTATLRRVNFYRAMAGLSNVSFDAEICRRCQAAALLMVANQALSHQPPPTWRWWSAEAVTTAAASNLAADDHSQLGPSAVDAYLADEGPSNYGVGHRRWLLFPPQRTMGSGSVPAGAAGPGTLGANVLWIDGPYATDPGRTTPAVVAWPPAGYLPVALLPRRWSLSVAAADFKAATITVSCNGASVPVAVEALRPDPVREPDAFVGLPTIVWVPQTGNPIPEAEDRTYAIRVDGIRVGGVPQPAYAYTLTTLPEAVTALPAGSVNAPDPVVSVVGDAGRGGFVISRTGAATAALTVVYHVGGGAISGTDYDTLSGRVTVPAGQSEVIIPLLARTVHSKVKVFLDARIGYHIGKGQSKVVLADL